MTAAITVDGVLTGGARRLRAAGIWSARREARLLLASAIGTSPEDILLDADRSLDAATVREFDGLLDRRSAREPMSQILGYREFWSLRFDVSDAVLTPRPDSETLVEAALADIRDRGAKLRLLDLGTGTGCLLLALLSELPGATGVGVDISFEAVGIAARNAESLGLMNRARFVVGDWAKAIDGRFDVVIANPPYVRSGDLDSLMPEVRRFEPREALDGGADGLEAYRDLVSLAAPLLSPGGRVVLEVGAGQGEAVGALLMEAGLIEISRRRDLAGIERCVVARRGGCPRR
jgi:release factor glutamine methyltransferase